MVIALDYDDTYTRDPDFWLKFLDLVAKTGHTVICVTMRTQGECELMDRRFFNRVAVYPTSRQAKRGFMHATGIKVDVWIDDTPDFILFDAKQK